MSPGNVSLCWSFVALTQAFYSGSEHKLQGLIDSGSNLILSLISSMNLDTLFNFSASDFSSVMEYEYMSFKICGGGERVEWLGEMMFFVMGTNCSTVFEQ